MIRKKVALVEELEARLIREIRSGRAASRQELANLHKLAPSTVGIYVDRLLASGHLLEISDPKPLQPGRPALRLGLCGDAGCFVGVEFEARNIHAVCVNFAGAVLDRHDLRLEASSGAEEVLAGLEAAISQVSRRVSLPLLGIGVGVPGLVDSEEGIARHYRFIDGWSDIPIGQRLRKRFNTPIIVENNARVTAMGILMFEPDQGKGDFVSLLIRSGVGAGIVINGTLHRGHDFLAGEIGRICIPCPEAGNAPAATLEDIASVQGIVSFALQELEKGESGILAGNKAALTIEHIIDAAVKGDDLARRSIQRAIRMLGWISHVITLVVNPGRIILTGRLNALGDWLALEVQAVLNAYSNTSKTVQPQILLSRLGESAGALGAASLAVSSWKPSHNPVRESGRRPLSP